MINKLIYLLVTYISLNSLIHIIAIPSILIGKTRQAAEFIKVLMTKLVSNLYTNGFNSDIYISGEYKKIKNKVNIIIGNHISTLDWGACLTTLNRLGIEKYYYFLKKGNLNIPSIGYLFAADNDLLVDQKWKTDENIIEKKIDNINEGTIIIFPEGTRFNEKKYKKGVEFSKANNLPIYDYTMVPRTKGIWKLISYLKKKNKLGNVYDFTFIIPDFLKKNAFFKDVFIKNVGDTYVNIHKVKLPNDKVINDINIFKQWFFKFWVGKNNRIGNYKKYNYSLYKPEIGVSEYILTAFSIITFVFLVKKFKHIYVIITFLVSYIFIFVKCHMK
jgi:lysocardiolipin and lysophospholipid acyltransferase